MTPSEFLNLPKIEIDFKERIKRQLEELRRKIKIVPSEVEIKEKDRCCGKRAFDSEQDALDSISIRRKTGYKPVRAYQCDNGKWHLTHLSLSEYRDKQNNYRFKT